MAAAQNISVRVGVVLDMDEYGKMAFNCISMALSDFYDTHAFYNTRLFLYNRDSKGDVIGAAAAGTPHVELRAACADVSDRGLDLLKNVEVQAIIGPVYSSQANFLISLGHKAHVPIITFSATSPSLSSLRSPYFIRATLKDSSQVGAIVAIIQGFGWREVVAVYENSEFGEGILPFLTDALEQVNVRVPYRSVISPSATDDQILAELYKLMAMQTRVFIVHMLNPLASRSNPILYLFFYLFTLKIFSTAQIPVRVGVVLDMDAYGNMSFNCISMALLDFYATHGHYNTRLVLINRDSREGVIGAAAAGTRPYRSIFPPLATDDQIAAELYKLMTMQTRVFVVHMLTSLASRLV